MADALAREGHESFLLAPKGTPAHDEAVARGLSTPDLGDLGSSNPWTALTSLGRIRKFLIEERIEIVNVHSGPGHALLALLCRSLRIPLVRTRGDIRPPKIHLFSRWLYRHGSRHHLISADFMRGSYTQLGVSDGEVTTLAGGTDLELAGAVQRDSARADIRRQLGLPPEAFLIGMVARLSPVKGHSYLLEAVARLAPTHPELHLVFAGPEAQRTQADVQEESVSLGLGSRVHLVGRVAEPLKWAAAFDVAVIASTDSEAICRSAFEYLAVGTPIVASDLNAIGEVLDEESALLVPPGDPEALARALVQLVDSADLRSSLSVRGRERASSEFSLQSLGRTTASLFAGLSRSEA